MSEAERQQSKLDVERACRCLWGSLALSAVALVVDFDRPANFPAAAHLVSIGAAYAFLAFLVVKIKSGKNWARYASLTITVLGFPFSVPAAIDDVSNALDGGSGQSMVLAFASPAWLVLQVMGLWLVFTRPGSNWFKRGEPALQTSQADVEDPCSRLVGKLAQLQELRDKELISLEDFEKKKAELLAKL
ncbi:SHOCT domain-containing protein [Coralloluteibacterium thermophilus]|uniref:SHOCT domain-containing protein n=1 Tax=Coralloluteibacterium thermophilum TaxID=2707049 RepID=A0ABV9NIZ8_9GAMM